MPTITKLYSSQEVAQHNSRDDCLVIIDGKELANNPCTYEGSNGFVESVVLLIQWRNPNELVCDVTSYLDEHPGGDDVLLSSAGRDATEEFEDAGHSESAREIMQDYCIGELDPSPIPKNTISEMEILSSRNSQELMNNTWRYWAFPVAIVGISVVIGMLYLRKK